MTLSLTIFWFILFHPLIVDKKLNSFITIVFPLAVNEEISLIPVVKKYENKTLIT